MGIIDIRSGQPSFTSIPQSDPIWVNCEIVSTEDVQPIAIHRQQTEEDKGYDSLVIPCKLTALGTDQDKLPKFDSRSIYRVTIFCKNDPANRNLVQATTQKCMSLIQQLGLKDFLLPEGTLVRRADHRWLVQDTRLDQSIRGAFVSIALAIQSKMVKSGKTEKFQALVWTQSDNDGWKMFANTTKIGLWPGAIGEETMSSNRYRRDQKKSK